MPTKTVAVELEITFGGSAARGHGHHSLEMQYIPITYATTMSDRTAERRAVTIARNNVLQKGSLPQYNWLNQSVVVRVISSAVIGTIP